MSQVAAIARQEDFPLASPFRISRGVKTEALVVVVEISRAGVTGRGECVPYSRYDETSEQVLADINAALSDLGDDISRDRVNQTVPAGAARNALDCALWDLDAKTAGTTVADLTGLKAPTPVMTAFTLGLDTPAAMQAGAEAAGRSLLKVKLGGGEDLTCIRAVRAGAPNARLVVDANEGWSIDDLAMLDPHLAELGVEMVEQPLPAADDSALQGLAHQVPLCADESFHDRVSIPGLVGKYDMVNIKLDKTGGLTEALAVADAAEAAGLGLMVGCMVGTSLAMAPAFLVAQRARVVDLDGPLLLKQDRENGFHFEGSVMHPPSPCLWG